jgi:hypothetical protein
MHGAVCRDGPMAHRTHAVHPREMLCIAMSGGVLRAEARGLLYLYQSNYIKKPKTAARRSIHRIV